MLVSRSGEAQHNNHLVLGGGGGGSEVGLVSASSRPDAPSASQTAVVVNTFSSVLQEGVHNGGQICLAAESKVTFLNLGAFASSYSNGSVSPARRVAPASSSEKHQQNPPMSRFMNLARKFNCFYFNGDLFRSL